MNTLNLYLSTMRALWGIITPNVRRVSVKAENDLIKVFFHYDEEPSEEEVELAEESTTVDGKNINEVLK
jgi:hypothetical protein